jgi:two-component system, cell cycle response regulator
LGSAQKVLIADDSPLVLRMIEKIVAAAGFEALTARDGLEAVEKAFTEDIDLVVLDVGMPRMNGYQACRLLKGEEATRDIPVVILTSKNQASDRFWGLETGADYYLTKDAEPARILELIKNVLADARQRPRAAPRERPRYSQDILSRVNEMLDRKLYEAIVLSEIGRVARSVHELDETFTSVMGVIERVVDFSVGALAFVEGEEVELLIALQHSVAEAVVEDAKARLLETIAREWKGPPLKQVRARSFQPKLPASGPEEISLGGFVAIPILTGGLLSGLLGLGGRSVLRMSAEDQALLEKVANQAHIVTENSRLVQRLKHLAGHDGLTELLNHRHTREQLQREFDRVSRYAGSLSLLMIDIDHFKQVNDRHGHPTGDTVLREVARVVKEAVRAVDVVGRYGGEEFAAILPQTDVQEARLLAERLRKAVEALAVPAPNAIVRVTISTGIASYPAPNIASPDDLIREADRALYRAKQDGRNRVA